MAEIAAIFSPELSSERDKRYVVIDKNTQEIVDDAFGYGYQSPETAYAVYAYRHRSKSKNKEKVAKTKQSQD